MKICSLKSLILSTLCLISAPAATAETLSFTYAKTLPALCMGTGKAEKYDVAILLPGGGYQGAKIHEVKVPVPNTPNISATSIWLSTELKLDASKLNLPNVATYNVTPTDGWLTLTLPTPYDITSEGVYVGYSLSVDAVDEVSGKPIIGSSDSDPQGFYIHSSKLYRNWSSQAEGLGFNSAISVTLEGEFGPVSVCVKDVPIHRTDINQASQLAFTVANYGTEPVRTLDVKYTIGSKTKIQTLQPEVEIPAQLNMEGTVVMPIEAIDQQGTLPLSIEILKVNGIDNPNAKRFGEGKVKVIPYHPKKVPFTEEYGGSWCAWCVRGMAGIERMHKLYGEEFVAVSYHTRDAMATISDLDFPNEPGGYPAAFLDREMKVDPYEGLSNSGFHYHEVWEAKAKEYTPASLSVAAQWDGDQIKADATLTFVEEPEADEYIMSYMLAEDGMTDPMIDGKTSSTWSQKNAYAGMNASDFEEELAAYCTKPSVIHNFLYDDVLLQSPHPYGLQGSLDGVKVLEPFTTSYTFSNIFENNGRKTIVQDSSKLFVVALLLERKTRRVLNCARVDVPAPAAVESIEGSSEILSTRWYDLSGRLLSAPVSGLMMRVDTYADGTVRTQKTVKP